MSHKRNTAASAIRPDPFKDTAAACNWCGIGVAWADRPVLAGADGCKEPSGWEAGDNPGAQ